MIASYSAELRRRLRGGGKRRSMMTLPLCVDVLCVLAHNTDRVQGFGRRKLCACFGLDARRPRAGGPGLRQAERPFRSCARRAARIRRWARRRSRQPARFADASIAHCEHQLRSTASPSFGQTIDVRRSVRVRRRAGRWRRQRPRCSRRRGISSTKLQGRKRLSSCSAKMPSQASLQAPVEPGIANR